METTVISNWTPSTIFAARDQYVILRDDSAHKLKLYTDGWAIAGQFEGQDVFSACYWLNQHEATYTPAPAPSAPLAAPTVTICANGVPVLSVDRAQFEDTARAVRQQPATCQRCYFVAPQHVAGCANTDKPRCPDCGHYWCSGCANLWPDPEPELPAYNPEDGAPCAQCGHGQELHYNGVAECWETSNTTPPVGCPCPQFQAREAAQRADEAEPRTVQCIHLERAEGLTWECSMEHVVFSLEDAESKLYEWAWTAPEPDQGYHKADVRIEYTDGTTHYVRADLQRGRYGYLPMPAPRPEPPNPADQAELQAGLLATLPPMAGGSVAPRCPDCGDSGAARDCEPCVLATLPPMAGGAPSHYDDPAWYADEAWHLQEERNAESAREEAEAEDEHTHFCPTCHQARPCTATGCADGPRECNTCSNCRGW